MKKLTVKVREFCGVRNQFTVETEDGLYFQSYQSVIVFKSNQGCIFMDKTYWDYSKTTSKYRNRFLDMDTKQIKQAIAVGSIRLIDLN